MTSIKSGIRFQIFATPNKGAMEAKRTARLATRIEQRPDMYRATCADKECHVGKRTPRICYDCKIMNWICIVLNSIGSAHEISSPSPSAVFLSHSIIGFYEFRAFSSYTRLE